MNLMQKTTEELSEPADSRVALAELFLKTYPSHELWLAFLKAVEPLGQPAVDVERYCGVGECGDGAFIKWHGETLQTVEVVE